MKLNSIFDRVFRKAIKKSFPFWQSLGLHIVANHFYEPIPDTRALRDFNFSKISTMDGININDEAMHDLAKKFLNYEKEFADLSDNLKDGIPSFTFGNESFESVDAEMLYLLMRSLKPNLIVEIGSGQSTIISAHALALNKIEGTPGKLIAIEPYPNKIISQGLSGMTLVKSKIQDVELQLFERMSENDILFIDSSHVAKVGSDVLWEFFEIIPKIKKGVYIHFHDIFLPVEYPKNWVLKDYKFWNEQYVLRAFLMYNNTFEVIWAGQYMHQKHSDFLKTIFKSYSENKSLPGSLWIRRIA